MKKFNYPSKKLLNTAILAMGIHLVGCNSPQMQHHLISVEAPFEMPAIQVPVYPDQDFPITSYGATETSICTDAIAQAIAACHEAGGGRVVIPAGTWLTGAVHLKSNVNLHLSEGAVLQFTDNPNDYLPAVHTSWEGIECYNYSPLIYAYQCENVAITGTGKIYPKMDLWRKWFDRPKTHMDALVALYHQMANNVPVENRQVAVGENNFRPHLIQLNRCKHVLLENFQIENSPFWTIHMYMCEDGVARNLNVYAHGHNNDGIDLDMTRNFLVEDCVFDQGDDAVVIKSGRNHDAWRLNTPSENIVVRNCTIKNGHTLLGIGSELSGGVRNVYMTNCVAPNTVHRLFFLKTNHRRGGAIENIHMDKIHVNGTLRIAEIDTDVLYQWRDLVPTYKDSLTLIKDIYLSDIQVDSAKAICELHGEERLPIQHVKLKDIAVNYVADTCNRVKNVEGFIVENVTFSKIDSTILPQLNRFLSNK